MKPGLLRTCSIGWAISSLMFVAGCGDEVGSKPQPQAIGTREELADEASLARLTDLRGLAVFGQDRYFQTGSWDRETGATPPASFVDRGNRDMNHFACKGAEGSVSEGQIVPPIYDIDICPEAYVRGVALARIEGSGRLARLWLTASSLRHGAVANDEIFRIWVDDDPNPVVEEPLSAIIDGSAGEMFAPPFGDGPGNHVAWYYPVVFAKKLVVGLDNLGPLEYYYDQVAVVLDPEPVARKAASTRLSLRDQAISVLSSTENGAITGEPLAPKTPFSLMPGQTLALFDLSGPATIHALRLEVAEAMRPMLSNVALRVTWDDAAVPAMDLPLADLFASSLDPVENSSLALSGTIQDGLVQVELRLPMPFEKNAKLVATNNHVEAVNFAISVQGDSNVPDKPFGKLFADRRETLAPASGKTHPLASVAGQGRWAGTCMMLEGRGIGDGTPFDEPLNFLEGDETAVLDGQMAIRGTGTEDYLNGAFYFEAGPFASPFAQWWGTVVTDKVARSSACRFHLLGDSIDFASSAEIELEIGPGLPQTLERYRTVAFLYR